MTLISANHVPSDSSFVIFKFPVNLLVVDSWSPYIILYMIQESSQYSNGFLCRFWVISMPVPSVWYIKSPMVSSFCGPELRILCIQLTVTVFAAIPIIHCSQCLQEKNWINIALTQYNLLLGNVGCWYFFLDLFCSPLLLKSSLYCTIFLSL